MQMTKIEERKEKTGKFGLVSTIFVFIAAPLASIFVQSPVGWCFHAVAASTGFYHQMKRGDKEMAVQFAFFFVMNVIAIVTRLLP